MAIPRQMWYHCFITIGISVPFYGTPPQNREARRRTLQ